MKKIFLLLFITLFSVHFSYAEGIEDDSIIRELEKTEKTQEETDLNINLQSFNSCVDMEEVLGNYIKTYWEKNKDKYSYYDRGGLMYKNVVMEDTAVEGEVLVTTSDSSEKSDDYSETNTQVKGVDEADIIKTDGKYIYYFSDKNSDDNYKYIYIVGVDDQKVVKKIKIPKTFYGVELYINNEKLTIIASGYSNSDYSKYYINRNTKTYAMVYDVSDMNNLKLDRIYLVDGNYKNSRMIGNYVYIISENSFNIPFYTFKSVDDIKITADSIIPKKLDLSYTNDKTKQNYKKYPYHIESGNVADCNDIEYILPDEDTLEKFDFAPAYNIVSVINTKNSDEEVKTEVVASNNSEMYMSTDNIYLTSYLYKNNKFSCPTYSNCIMPYYNTGTNTLIHKFGVSGSDVDYKKSTLVPGQPLTQYSMDEYKGNFRILTQTNNWNSKGNERYTGLYILDENLDLKGKLENLGNGENFKSSRYIGEKLFLVTFENIDPLFVIDVSDAENPKILGELKIPGYSTYLHPYDENHLIGLGYDTFENQWGGTQNGGLKVDLYEINYDKTCSSSDLTEEEEQKCEDGTYKGIIAKQQYSEVFGGKGSSSEATYNPKMFMWNSSKGKLFLPATLRDYDKNYKNKDYFQGMLAIDIDKDLGIKEDYRITNIDLEKIETKRQEVCSQYKGQTGEKICKTLLNGEEYCYFDNSETPPDYCFSDANVWDYFNNNYWQYRDSFIKRALWIGDKVFTISDDNLKASNMENGKNIYDVELN